VGSFQVNASHPDNSRIVASASGSLTADGSDIPVSITLPIAATVTGNVTDPKGTAVANVTVTVQSANASFGGFQSATTDSNGVYTIPGVPEGSFTATVQDLGRQLFGQSVGTVQIDGQPVTTNIAITNNAVQLPVTRYDANRATYQ